MSRMNYDFDSIIDRTQAASVKWSPRLRQEMYGEQDILPLGIADMDFRAAPAVAAAIRERAAHENYGYGYLSDEFLEACVNWQKRRNGWEIQKDWITYTPGLNLPLVFSIELFSEPGDNVIIQSPVYYPYYDYVNRTGRHILYNPLVNRDGHYEMNYELLEEQARDPRTRLILLCSPQNPTGRLWTREELLRLGTICIDHGLKVIVDEIHSDLVLTDRPFVPFASICDRFAQNSVICTSPSKSFNVAGLLVSDIIIPNDELRAAFQNKMQPYYLWPGAFGAVAQIAAYNESEDWLEELKKYLRANARYIDGFLKERLPGVRFRIPEATYLGWLDFRAYGMNDEELWNLLCHRARVATDDGPRFGPCGEGSGFQRLNFACPRQQLAQALNRIADAFDGR